MIHTLPETDLHVTNIYANNLKELENKVNSIENTYISEFNIDVPEDIIYVSDDSEFENIENPSESALYITEDTGYLYMYRDETFVQLDEEVDDTIRVVGTFEQLSEILKQHTASKINNVILFQASNSVATYKLVTSNTGTVVNQTLTKDQRDGTPGNIRTRHGNLSHGVVTSWTNWDLKTPIYKESTFSNLNTTNKTLVGAINEVALSGGDSTYTAGTNINIDANNVISAKGYTWDANKYSFAAGYQPEANALYSVALGYKCRVDKGGVAVGYRNYYGDLISGGTPAFVVGINDSPNGVGVNGLAIDTNGNCYIKGIGSYDGQASGQSLQDVITDLTNRISALEGNAS